VLVACAVMGTGTYMATAKASAAVGRYQIGNERVIDTMKGYVGIIQQFDS